MTEYFPVPGAHLLIDFWGASNLQDASQIEQTLTQAAQACNATVLGINLHSFGENAGVTGVALLAESHISIHTWPEIGFVALDVFMCGACNPHDALPVLERFFAPQKIKVTATLRGESTDD
jgi:S-adenosylmethionine decarboxylase